MSSKLMLGREYDKLKVKKILIVGVGGVGSHVAMLLSRMGLPLTIVDPDIVDETNLERQILFGRDDLNKLKVEVVKEKLKEFSQITDIYGLFEPKMVHGFDLVLDCTDNMETRLKINDACKQYKVPWIYSGAVKDIGTVLFISPLGPCFTCLFNLKGGENSCEVGVMNYTVALVGSLIVSLAIDYLAYGKVEGKMIRIDGHNISKIVITSRCDC